MNDLFGLGQIIVGREVLEQWAEEFLPSVVADPAVSQQQFWFNWNDVGAACSTVLERECKRVSEAVTQGRSAVLRSGDVKPKTLALLLDPDWWKASGRGSYS